MRAIKLWLEPDEKFPQFNRLTFNKAEVPLSDVLLKGIHPWDYGSRLDNLCEKTTQILNSECLILPELKEFGYSSGFGYGSERDYYREGSIFERLLTEIKERVFFVDSLGYLELIAIAKKTLQDDWTNERVYSLIGKICHDFNSIRDFIKKKDKSITLSSYNDIQKYELSRILSLSDFENEDKVLIDEAIPMANFRLSDFLGQITDERGFLKLAPSIDHFQMRFGGTFGDYSQAVLYNCQRRKDKVRFYPVMSHYPAMRETAQKIAQKWAGSEGKYCFTISIRLAEEMIESGSCQILFPGLNYIRESEVYASYAQIVEGYIPRFTIGGFVKAGAAGETIKDILRRHGVSMTGRKEELLEKLATLAASLYRQKSKELDGYFKGNRFIKVEQDGDKKPNAFPVLDGFDLRNIVLAMYAAKHLKGNVILDGSYTNDTFELVPLAKALINCEITMNESFVRVNGDTQLVNT